MGFEPAADVAGQHFGLQPCARCRQPPKRRSAVGGARPDVERHSSILVLLGGEATVYRGHEGVRELLRDLYAAFSELEAVYPEVRDLGDRVLASGRLRGRGRASGAEVESPLGYVVDFQDAKAIWVHAFTRRGATVPASALFSSPCDSAVAWGTRMVPRGLKRDPTPVVEMGSVFEAV